MPLRKKGIYLLPNLITLAAMFGGFYAIVMAISGRFEMAAVGIFVAMVLDGMDGREIWTRQKIRRKRRWVVLSCVY